MTEAEIKELNDEFVAKIEATSPEQFQGFTRYIRAKLDCKVPRISDLLQMIELNKDDQNTR